MYCAAIQFLLLCCCRYSYLKFWFASVVAGRALCTGMRFVNVLSPEASFSLLQSSVVLSVCVMGNWDERHVVSRKWWGLAWL